TALIDVWPKFVEWLDDDRDRRRKWQLLRATAEKWRDNNFSDSLLWAGAALDEAEKYANLDALQSKFLTSSRRRQNRLIWQRRVLVGSGVAVVVAVLALLWRIERVDHLRDVAVGKAKQAELNAAAAKSAEQTAKSEAETRHANIRMALMSINAALHEVE